MMSRLILAISLAFVCGSAAAIDPFTPLTASATTSNTNEATQPFLLPQGWTQTKVIDFNTLNGPAHFNGSYPSTFQWWDMTAIDANNSDILYIPHEYFTGGGVTRYDRGADTATILLEGNATFNFSTEPVGWSHLNDDFGTLDPAVYTPWDTLLTAEEGIGSGRLFELTNPSTATGAADAQWNWRSNIPSVAHEGIKFDGQGNMFFVDEFGSGSIYKFEPTSPGDLSVGQTFVLDATAFAGNSNETLSSAANIGQTRTGAATWTAITDENGEALTTADPFDFSSKGGRAAADEVGATPYGRPEDLEVRILANGNLGLFFAATDENIVYSIELDPNGVDSTIREFVNSLTTPDTLGNDPVGTGGTGAGSNYGLRFVDNLAVDPDGDIFILEDNNPGDIWVARDTDNDGIAETVSLFASLAVPGTEPTGFIYDPQGGYLVNVMHPTSDNDALWRIHPVPVPAAVWLFGSALAGLGWLRRRQTA